MAQAKKPQDRQPKQVKPSVTQTDAGWDITHQGIAISVPREALDDFELLDDLAVLQRDEKRGTPRVPSMLRRLAGEDGYQAVLTGLRDASTGRVPASVAVRFVFEVFQALNPNG